MGRGKMVHLLIPFNVVSRNHWGYWPATLYICVPQVGEMTAPSEKRQ
jgi:hypothetical protein